MLGMKLVLPAHLYFFGTFHILKWKKSVVATSSNLGWVHYVVFSKYILKVSRHSGLYEAEPTVQVHFVKSRDLDKRVQMYFQRNSNQRQYNKDDFNSKIYRVLTP